MTISNEKLAERLRELETRVFGSDYVRARDEAEKEAEKKTDEKPTTKSEVK